PLGRAPHFGPSQPPAPGDRYVDQAPRPGGGPDGSSPDTAVLDGREGGWVGQSSVVSLQSSAKASGHDFPRGPNSLILCYPCKSVQIRGRILPTTNDQRPTTNDQPPSPSLHLNYL